MKTTLGRILLLLITFSAFGLVNIMAFEEPKYKVLEEYDEFEIREYSPYIVAETEVDSDLENAGNIAHKILFDFISGNNVGKKEIEMTVPVNQKNSDLQGEKIEMTTPVSQREKLNSSGKFIVSFVMPSRFTLATVPVPKDPRIKLREISKKIVAVRKYSGTWSENNYRENEEILLDEVKKKELTIVGEPVYARYNPPFWPWFLRRNEVQIELNYQKS